MRSQQAGCSAGLTCLVSIYECRAGYTTRLQKSRRGSSSGPRVSLACERWVRCPAAILLAPSTRNIGIRCWGCTTRGVSLSPDRFNQAMDQSRGRENTSVVTRSLRERRMQPDDGVGAPGNRIIVLAPYLVQHDGLDSEQLVSKERRSAILKARALLQCELFADHAWRVWHST